MPPPGCGGSVTGDFGVLNGVFDIGCEWIITVQDGFRVEIEFEEIHVSELTMGGMKRTSTTTTTLIVP